MKGRVFMYDVMRDHSRLIESNIDLKDIERKEAQLKRRYGYSSVVRDGNDIIVLRTRA